MSDLTIEVKTQQVVHGRDPAGARLGAQGGFSGRHAEMALGRGRQCIFPDRGPRPPSSLENGLLVGKAQLKPPANLMKPVIEQKIAAVMKKVAEHL